MPSYSSPPPRLSFEQVWAPFLANEGLPFSEVLPAADVAKAFADAGTDFGTAARSVFTPETTLWAFLSQVLAKDQSCRAAVARVLALRLDMGQTACSTNTAAYCRARAQLPATVLQRLTEQEGRNLEAQLPPDWRWHGKQVTWIDGTTLTLPDTEENQAAYPQLSSQQPGVGFPIVRLVVLLSLTSACLLGMAMAHGLTGAGARVAVLGRDRARGEQAVRDLEGQLDRHMRAWHAPLLRALVRRPTRATRPPPLSRCGVPRSRRSLLRNKDERVAQPTDSAALYRQSASRGAPQFAPHDGGAVAAHASTPKAPRNASISATSRLIARTGTPSAPAALAFALWAATPTPIAIATAGMGFL